MGNGQNGGASRACIVLMYHRIGEIVAQREPGEDIYVVRAPAFREQMQHLRDAQVPVRELHEVTRTATPVQESVVLTFDDGSSTDIEVAAPILTGLGWSGTFFITPAWVGTPGYMQWSDVKELHRMGMSVGAHGLDHTRLSSLSRTELGRHLREARRELGARLGQDPIALSMPGGAGGRREFQVAREEGFQVVAGSVPRRWWPGGPPSIVPRFAVRRADSAAAFRALVAQRPLALLDALSRYTVLRVLRRTLGEARYQRVRSRHKKVDPS